MKKMFQFSGPVNEVLRWLGMDFLALDWIGSSDVALSTVMVFIIWRESALGIILFLARLLSLDESLIEAFRRGDDIHDQTALKVFGPDSPMDPHKRRSQSRHCVTMASA